MDGTVTEFVDINRSVPQGAVLGLFLFSLIVNDIKPLEPKDNLLINIIFFSLLDSDWLKSVPINPETSYTSCSKMFL